MMKCRKCGAEFQRSNQLRPASLCIECYRKWVASGRKKER